MDAEKALREARGAIGWFGGFGAPICSRNINELPTEQTLHRMLMEANSALNATVRAAFEAGIEYSDACAAARGFCETQPPLPAWLPEAKR